MAKETKKICVCVGTFTDGSLQFAKKRVDAVVAAGFKEAKIIPDKTYIKVITGKEYPDEETAKKDAEELTKKDLSAFVITL